MARGVAWSLRASLCPTEAGVLQTLQNGAMRPIWTCEPRELDVAGRCDALAMYPVGSAVFAARGGRTGPDPAFAWHRGVCSVEYASRKPGAERVGERGPVDSDDRWREANRLLDHTPDDATVRHLRRRRRTALLIVGGGFLIIVVGSVFVAAIFAGSGHHPVHRHTLRPPLWRAGPGLAVILCGLVLLFASMVKQIRSGAFGPKWARPMTALTRRQRRLLYRQVMGKVPADAAQLPLARHMALWLIRQQGPFQLLFMGLAVGQVGQAILVAQLWRAVFAAALITVAVVCIIVLHQRATRAKLFIEHHPPYEVEEAAGSR